MQLLFKYYANKIASIEFARVTASLYLLIQQVSRDSYACIAYILHITTRNMNISVSYYRFLVMQHFLVLLNKGTA